VKYQVPSAHAQMRNGMCPVVPLPPYPFTVRSCSILNI
jgi:hypothetical protein